MNLESINLSDIWLISVEKRNILEQILIKVISSDLIVLILEYLFLPDINITASKTRLFLSYKVTFSIRNWYSLGSCNSTGKYKIPCIYEHSPGNSCICIHQHDTSENDVRLVKIVADKCPFISSNLFARNKYNDRNLYILCASKFVQLKNGTTITTKLFCNNFQIDENGLLSVLFGQPLILLLEKYDI